MTRADEERARREKLVEVWKRFWVLFISGVLCIFLGVALVGVGNSTGNFVMRLAGLVCGCYGLFLDLTSLFYLLLKRRLDILPRGCFDASLDDDILPPATEDGQCDGENPVSNFERPPSYRTCVKMESRDSPPSYTEVVLSISGTNQNDLQAVPCVQLSSGNCPFSNTDARLIPDSNVPSTDVNCSLVTIGIHLENADKQSADKITHQNGLQTVSHVQLTNGNCPLSDTDARLIPDSNAQSTDVNCSLVNVGVQQANADKQSANQIPLSMVENVQNCESVEDGDHVIDKVILPWSESASKITLSMVEDVQNRESVEDGDHVIDKIILSTSNKVELLSRNILCPAVIGEQTNMNLDIRTADDCRVVGEHSEPTIAVTRLPDEEDNTNNRKKTTN